MVNWSGIPPAAGVAIYTFMVHSEAALVYQLMEVGYGHDKGLIIEILRYIYIYIHTHIMGLIEI